ncbi:MAG: hypothetical protein AAFO06_11910 [Cyanobacteria bacterium J06597_16]
MLSQLVRPMVRTQLQLLANSNATRSTLVTTIAHWLGFLGVRASVQQVDAVSNQIQVSLTVGKPDACNDRDWTKILENLTLSSANDNLPMMQPDQMSDQQKSKFYRLLAYVIQVGYPNQPVPDWEEIRPQVQTLGFLEDDLAGIRAALKVPQDIDHLMRDLDPDVAAIALSKAVNLALLDRQVNPTEDKALNLLLNAMKQSNPVS